MKTFVHDMDVRREGRIEGIELGKSFGKMSLVCKKLRKGKSVEAIAEELEEENSEISDMCEIAKKFAPDYDEEMVWKNYLSKYMLD